MSRPYHIIEAITEAFGARCEEFDPSCKTCRSWAELDAILLRIEDLGQQLHDEKRLRGMDWDNLRGEIARLELELEEESGSRRCAERDAADLMGRIEQMEAETIGSRARAALGWLYRRAIRGGDG